MNDSKIMLLLVALVAFLCLEAIGAPKEERKLHGYIEFSALFENKRDESEALKQFRKMEELRENALSSLLKLRKQRPRNLELNLRLGELYLQRARDLEQYSLELDSYGKGEEAKEKMKQVGPLYRKGLKLQKSLLPRLKGHELQASVYLGLARTLLRLRKKNQALGYAESGLKVVEAESSTARQLWMVKGDLAFDLSKAALARHAYDQALKLTQKNTLQSTYLHYRLAWAEYNMKDPAEAIKHLKAVLEQSGARFSLKAEAVKDFSLFAADLSKEEYQAEGGTPGIFHYLKERTGLDSAFDSIVYLGKVFSKNGNRQRAIDSYEYLIDEDKENPKNAELALTLIEWTKTLADQSKVVERFHWLIKDFGPHSKWYASLRSKPDVQKNARDSIERATRSYAIDLHKELRKEASKERKEMLYHSVASLYDEHIKAFNDFPRIRFYRAEIHRDQKEWAASARNYDEYVTLTMALASQDLWEDVDEKLSPEAHKSAVEMWAKALEDEEKHFKSFLAASDRYLKAYPDSKISAQLAFDAARVELQYGNKALALSRIQELVKSFPKTSQAAKAVHAALDILNKEEDFTNLAVQARTWLDSINDWAPAAEKKKLNDELSGILSKTEAKACESLGEEGGREVEAALCYQRFANGFQDDPLAPKALFLSSELFEKRGNHSSALDSLELLTQRHPDSAEAVDAFSKLANSYEKTFQFEKAAGIYEQLVKRDDFKKKDLAVGRLLAIYQGFSKADDLNRWLKDKRVSSKQRDDVLEKENQAALLRLLFLEHQQGYGKSGLLSKEASAIYQELQAEKKAGRLAFEQRLELARIEGWIASHKGKLGEADKIWMAALKEFWRKKSKSKDVWRAAARVRLAQSSFWRKRFDKLTLTNSPQKKLEVYQKLENWYAKVIEMKSPEVALEALWETAELYRVFSQELKALPQTQAQGVEMENSSKELLVRLAKSAKEWRVFSPVLIKALSVLKGKEYELNGIEGIALPWKSLPRVVELSDEEKKWDEWKDSEKSLLSALAKARASRSSKQRAAFVLLYSRGSLEDKKVSEWAKLLNQKQGVQLRIQALINDGHFKRAELYLSQYLDLFKKDDFSTFIHGSLAWSQGKMKEAYELWRHGIDSASFEAYYMAASWNASFEKLVEGQVSESTSNEIIEGLKKRASLIWHKQYLAYLCLNQDIQCGESSLDFGEILAMENPAYRQRVIKNSPNFLKLRHESFRLLLEQRIASVEKMADAYPLREDMQNFKLLGQEMSGADRRGAYEEYKRLSAMLNSKEVQVTRAEDAAATKTVAGQGG